MLYELVQKTKGREHVKMVDTKAKVEAQKRKYDTSQKGKVHGNRVEYFIRQSTQTESFKRGPRSNWNSYN
jgi:hypothetical protein